MKFKKWIFPNIDKQFVAEIADDCRIDTLVAFVAVSRGFDDPYEIDRFFSNDADFSDPYEYSGMSDAVDRINIALESEEKILVFGDYDCDGVTATALLTSYLKSKGADVDFVVPDRENDGYGISVSAVEKAAMEGYTLIITVDNGINAIKEVERANELGVDVVVTDHHLPQAELPDAVAVVDPHIDDECDWIFSDLCGVGVAFKLICAIEGRPAEELVMQYGDLVALGTIADVVPLIGENRFIVKYGLELINRKVNHGIRALCEVSASKYVTSLNAAFTICPRINAAGRMASAETAVKMFMAESYDEALFFAGLLDSYNTNRQTAEQSIFEEACKTIEENSLYRDRVIVVSGRNWHIGVIGIVASKITEKYAKPCIVINRDGERSVGSGRSLSPFSLFNAISTCSDILVKFGGHELAAGLTIDEEYIDEFKTRINRYAVTVEAPYPTVKIDCRLRPSAFTVDAVEELKALEPYGASNPTPVFAVTECTLLGINPIASGKHIRLKLRKDNTDFWAVMFNTSVENFAYKTGSKIDIAVTLDINVYNNIKSVSIIIRHIRKFGLSDDIIFSNLKYLDQLEIGTISSDGAKEIYPNRDEMSFVFRYLKSAGFVKEDLAVNDLLDNLPLGKIIVSLNAFCELGLVSLENGNYSVLPFNGKADLEQADTLKKLKSYIGGV